MSKRTAWALTGLIVLLCAGGVAGLLYTPPAFDPSAALQVDRPPRIAPDVSGTVIPPNIAPVNLVVREPGTAYGLRIHAARGEPVDVASWRPALRIPASPWRALLQANRGGDLRFDVHVRQPNGRWIRFPTLTCRVAEEPIDRYLFYRLLEPYHNLWGDLGIYQRDMESHAESVILHNRSLDGGCVNCHTVSPGHPDRMILHIRGARGNAMLLSHGGQVRKIDTRSLYGASPAAYTAWHPTGRLAAFSVNKLEQFFHAVGETRDVFDSASDLAVYDVDAHEVFTAPAISAPDRNETFPAWSPDGRHLYFSAADPRPRRQFRQVRYDLMRAEFDPTSRTWGPAQTVLSAEDMGTSLLEPRVSPDGRWLLFCMCEYGTFPAFSQSSDLYLMDLATKKVTKPAINSDETDSWHSWSSNSRWIAFASKRQNGLLARIYLSHVDKAGRCAKPLVLPQRDPTLYARFTQTYNAPELSPHPAPASGRAWAAAAGP